MSLKHRIKQALRTAYAKVLFHSGLHAVVDRAMPRRMTILFGHCVDQPDCNGFLPRDMKIRRENLERVLAWFGRRYAVTSIRDGHAALVDGRDGRSVVALSFDDGYRDNRTDLLPILERYGAGATIFLETGAMDGAPINWSHKYHWVMARRSIEDVARRYVELAPDSPVRREIDGLLAGSRERLAYHVKRLLKYEAAEDERDGVLDRIFREAGGDEERLRRELYMSWDDVRALHAAGIELGGHTIHHVILSRVPPDRQRAEIEGSRASIERELGPGSATTFAYPFGRRWDYDETSRDATRAAGYALAVNTHAGTVRADSPRYELRRLPVDDNSRIELLVAEACGGFDLLRRFGIDLSE